MAYVEVTSKLGKRIRISDSYWAYIARVKHREMVALKDTVVEALRLPIEIRRSQKDPSVHQYYGRYDDKLVCVVARHLNEEGFIITAYLTHKVGRGKLVWRG